MRGATSDARWQCSGPRLAWPRLPYPGTQGLTMQQDHEPLSVFVVEDDPLLARHVREAISCAPGLWFSGHAASLAAARLAIAKLRPAVVLSDLGLPDGDGATLIRELKSPANALQGAAYVPHILVFSVFGEEGHVLRAIEAGADGYLLKGCSQGELIIAIEQAARGESPISPPIARYLLRHFREDAAAPMSPATDAAPSDLRVVSSPLSPREEAVLKLVAQGYVTEEIADKLTITSHTVASHIRNIYVKLQVHKRAQAVSEAQRRGWLG